MNTACARREVYTVSVDTRFVRAPASNNAFTAYMNIPLRNVVKAELLAASIHPAANTSGVVYMHVAELVNKFRDHAPLIYQQNVSGISSNVSGLSQIVSNVNFINEALLMYPINGSDLDTPLVPRVVYRTNSDFPVVAEFIEPIRRLDRLTVSMYADTGAAFLTSAPTFLTFRFECAKDNVCLY
jgi:hypothetical protein